MEGEREGGREGGRERRSTRIGTIATVPPSLPPSLLPSLRRPVPIDTDFPRECGRFLGVGMESNHLQTFDGERDASTSLAGPGPRDLVGEEEDEQGGRKNCGRKGTKM